MCTTSSRISSPPQRSCCCVNITLLLLTAWLNVSGGSPAVFTLEAGPGTGSQHLCSHMDTTLMRSGLQSSTDTLLVQNKDPLMSSAQGQMKTNHIHFPQSQIQLVLGWFQFWCRVAANQKELVCIPQMGATVVTSLCQWIKSGNMLTSRLAKNCNKNWV